MESRSSYLSVEQLKQLKPLNLRRLRHNEQQRKNYQRDKLKLTLIARITKRFLIKLGLKGGGVSLRVYQNRLQTSCAWNKANRERKRVSDRRYEAKIIAKYGS